MKKVVHDILMTRERIDTIHEPMTNGVSVIGLRIETTGTNGLAVSREMAGMSYPVQHIATTGMIANFLDPGLIEKMQNRDHAAREVHPLAHDFRTANESADPWQTIGIETIGMIAIDM